MNLEKIILCLATVFTINTIEAQKQSEKDYLKMREDLDARIFNSNDSIFQDNTIPEKYKSESAIVLAQKQTLESDSKIKFLLFSINSLQYTFLDIFRRKILINDHSALAAFSQTDFKKLKTNTWGMTGRQKHYTFFNVRIIKRGGLIKKVNLDETTVLIKDEKDEQETKIAIPELELGDIIDYYIASYRQEVDNNEVQRIYYQLTDEYSILKHDISLQFDTRIAVEYQCLNGAPEFTITTSPEGGKQLTAHGINISRTVNSHLYSPSRQSPIIRLHYKQGTIAHSGGVIVEEGQVVKANNKYPSMIEEDLAGVFNYICKDEGVNKKIFKSEFLLAQKAFKKYTNANPAANQKDSIASFVFRYLNWLHVYKNLNVQKDFVNSYQKLDLNEQLKRVAEFAYVLLWFKIDVDFVVGADKAGYRKEDYFYPGDLSVMVRTQGKNSQYFCFADNLDFAQTIPYHLTGTEARIFPFNISPLGETKLLFVTVVKSRVVKLPSTDYNANYTEEKVTIEIPDISEQKVSLKKTTTVWNYLKKKSQVRFFTLQEFMKQSGQSIGIDGDLLSNYNLKNSQFEKNAEELKAVLNNAFNIKAKEIKDYLQEEYGVPGMEDIKLNVLDYGLDNLTPLMFEQSFKLTNLVKKAGDHYIIDIGNLITAQYEKFEMIKINQDIYLKFPSSNSFHIEFSIPTSYSISGVNNLSTITENKTGHFSSKANVKDGKLLIDVVEYFSRDIIPVNNSAEFIELVSAATSFKKLKILLKRI